MSLRVNPVGWAQEEAAKAIAYWRSMGLSNTQIYAGFGFETGHNPSNEGTQVMVAEQVITLRRLCHDAALREDWTK